MTRHDRTLVPQPSETPLRLGILTPHNPYDPRTFSGTVFHAVRSLRRRPDIHLTLLGPHRPAGPLGRILGRPSPRFEPEMLDPTGADFHGLDAVLGLVASPLLDRATALTDLPMIHVTDATPGFLRDVYGRDVPEAATAREARVLARTTVAYSSIAMAQRARSEFGGAAARARSLPFGVNFSDLPTGLPQKRSLDQIELLFVGGDWERKGGALALAAFEGLSNVGQRAHLTLVGHVPAEVRARLKTRRDVTVAGFLDKNRPRDLDRLAGFFAKAHVFVLPTRADCTPMVIAEALAHGTPVLASDIGGISEMIGPGAGRTMPTAATANDWSAALREMTDDPDLYAMMSDAAVERTTSTLNWDSWAAGIAEMAIDVAAHRFSPAA